MKPKLRKTLLALLTCVFAVALLTACQGSNTTQQTDAPNGDIVVGSDNYPPYNYLDENGRPTGIDIDITTEAFKRMGYSVKYEYISWEEKDNLLADGSIDCAAGCFSMTGREDLYNWAGPYMTSSQVVAVNPNSDIKTLADLEGKVVAVQATTKPETILLDRLNKAAGKPKNVYCLADRSLIFPLLSKGYVDALAAHEGSIVQYEKDYGVEYRILEENLLDVGLGIAFDKNDTRGIAEKLDATLSEMHADGTLENIVSKYVDNASKYLEVDASDE